MKPEIQIILIEDSPDYRETLALTINMESDMEVADTFGASEVALRNLQNGPKPDLILLDLGLPGMSGLDAIPWLQQYCPDTKIIALTQSNKEADVLRAIALGINGYLLKSSTVKQIKDGIRSVMEGGTLMDSEVAGYIVNMVKTKPAAVKIEEPLTTRELEVLVLVSEGLQKKDVGEKLDISYATVATHIRHIYEKLQVENAPAAITKAFKAGILPYDD
ncbi:response regulator transcription factor [Pontiellaceae bacterium B12227]|nr:response regulator transcription factor [Pontiellaceae bacterium B12227]